MADKLSSCSRPAQSGDVMHLPVTMADMRLAYLLNALRQKGRIDATGLVVVGRTIEVQSRTRSAGCHLPVRPNRVDNRALAIRSQSVAPLRFAVRDFA
jgi:hypothetical protein